MSIIIKIINLFSYMLFPTIVITTRVNGHTLIPIKIITTSVNRRVYYVNGHMLILTIIITTRVNVFIVASVNGHVLTPTITITTNMNRYMLISTILITVGANEGVIIKITK